jgi:CysZ protein
MRAVVDRDRTMIRALFLALEQLSDPVIQRLVLRCVALALGTFVGLVLLVGLGLAALDVTGIIWLDAALGFAGSGLMVLLAWLLFPVTVIVIVNLFAEQVADAVERRHYPGLPPVAGARISDSFWATAKLAAIGIVLNLLALPLYFLPGPNILIYLALNGYLLGREYFETVAQRRLGLRAVAGMRRSMRLRVWLSGTFIAMMLAIPLFNLVAPVIATAFMTHLFVAWRRQTPAAARVPPARSEA